MHLVLVINSLGIGGAERILIRLAHYWADSGHKISFITFFQEEKFSYQLASNNINLINLGEDKLSSSKLSFIQHFFKIVKRVCLLRNKIKLLQPDMVVSFLVGANISVLLANIGFKVPVIVSERADPFMHNIPTFYKKLRFLIYQQAAAITVQTQAIASYFVSKFQKNVFVIPNFVKSPKIKKDIREKTSISKVNKVTKIISVGRLDEQKDHKTLIYAFAKLSNDYPDLTLTIYGDGELRGFLQNLIMDLNLQDRVFLPGISMDVEKNLVAADLFVFPSIAEGFSNALSEAMSCGLPVIAADCAGNMNIIEHEVNGLLFKCGNVEELVLLMQRLLNNPEYCNKLAINAQNIVNKFSEVGILKLWDDVLEFSRAVVVY